MKVFIASHYKAALDILRKAALNKQPMELVILDYLMPELDGAELGEVIINDDDIPDCPLVIYTSSAQKGDARKFQEIGFSGYLTKPTLSDVIHDTLEYVLGEYSKNHGRPEKIITKYDVIESAGEESRSINLKGVRVLLAEDNMVNQKVAKSILKKHQLDILVASNGLEALALFKSNDFDVVLMDCQMPVMDGFEATRQIIEYQQQNDLDVPVIALTANALEDDKKRCLEAGMKDFIAKPFTTENLLQTIQNLTSDSAQAATHSEPQSAPKTHVKVLDESVLNVLRDAMGEDFGELIPAFFDSTGQIIDALKQAQQDGDVETLQRNAHSLKSSSASLGAMSLSALAKTLEQLCKEWEEIDPQQIDTIEQEFTRVKQALQDYNA